MHGCYNTLNYNFKASFFVATTGFAFVDFGRRGLDVIFPLFDSVNITQGTQYINLARDIIGGVLVGIPGNTLLLILIAMGITFNLCPSIVVIALSAILSYATCVLILLHMIGSIRYIAGIYEQLVPCISAFDRIIL
jgi:hypothetical protein